MGDRLGSQVFIQDLKIHIRYACIFLSRLNNIFWKGVSGSQNYTLIIEHKYICVYKYVFASI